MVPGFTWTCLGFFSPGTASRFWASGFWSGLPGPHLPTAGKDRSAAGDQPEAAETDLWSAEGQQDDQGQRGRRERVCESVL